MSKYERLCDLPIQPIPITPIPIVSFIGQSTIGKHISKLAKIIFVNKSYKNIKTNRKSLNWLFIRLKGSYIKLNYHYLYKILRLTADNRAKAEALAILGLTPAPYL